MENTRKYIWTIYVLLWVYFLFFDSSYSQSDHIGLYLFAGWIPFVVLSLIWRKKGVPAQKDNLSSQVTPSKIKNKEWYVNWMWWKSDEADIEYQVKNYNILKITKSYRGISSLLFVFSAVITLLLVLFNASSISSYADVVLSLFLAFFMYKGHKWSLIVGMAYWTLSKGIQIFDGAGKTSPIIAIVWWVLYMNYLYKAYKVERQRA